MSKAKNTRHCRIDGGYFDEQKYPLPPKQVEPIAERCNHTPCPDGVGDYFGWQEWAEQAAKTHEQIRCPRCGLWAIWLPKHEARAINKVAAAEERAMLAKMQRAQKAAQKAYDNELRK